MKKLFALTLVLLISVSVACAYEDKAFVQQIDLGRDNSGCQWYLIGYGRSQFGWYAAAREYYPRSDLKAEAVNKLTGYYRVPYDKAASIYFTEYRFEYTPEGGQYAEVSRVFYNMQGNEIGGYRTGHMVFNPVVPNTIQSKGVAYAMGSIR